MPIAKRVVTNPAKTAVVAKTASPAPKVAAVEETVTDTSSTTVSLYRGMSIDIGENNYAKIGVTITGARDNIDAMREDLGTLAGEELQLAIEQVKEFAFDFGEAAADVTEAAEEGAAETSDEGSAEEEIGPESIMKMNRAGLIEVLEQNPELGLDADDYPNTPKGLTAFREAVVAAAFADSGDDATADSTAEVVDDTDGGAEITVDEINAMDRPTLVALITANEIAVDHTKLTKLTALKAAVVSALESGDEATEAAEEDATIESYTRENLSTMTLADLKAIYTDWEMGDFPKGAPPVVKKTAITAILAAQAG